MIRFVACFILLAPPAAADDATYTRTLIAGEATSIEIRVWGIDGGDRHTRRYYETPMTFLTQRSDGKDLTPADRLFLLQIVPTCPRGYIRDLNMRPRKAAMETTFVCRANAPVFTSGNPQPISE